MWSVDTTVAPTTNRIWTIPNVLSFVRLCCIPIFVWLLFGRDDRMWASILLGTLGATDWVDGFIARRYGQVSELGKVLDPAADRLLLIVGVGSIIIDGSAPVIVSVLVVAREVLLGAALVILTLLGMERFDVTYWGKLGTFLLMFAFPAFLMGNADVATSDLFTVLGWACAIPGIAISWYAAITYIPTMARALRAGRARKAST